MKDIQEYVLTLKAAFIAKAKKKAAILGGEGISGVPILFSIEEILETLDAKHD